MLLAFFAETEYRETSRFDIVARSLWNTIGFHRVSSMGRGRIRVHSQSFDQLVHLQSTRQVIFVPEDQHGDRSYLRPIQ